jgi:predicted AlkP superfamily phosphohydrolase/phosphomutase
VRLFHLDGLVWQNKEHTRAMATALVEAIERRSAIGQWLCAERMRDWDLALIVVSEFHSALEALWHGYDPAHPLHRLPSATAAHAGIVGVYEAFDRMLGRYRTAMPEADLVLFSMHGMGANDSDVPTMLLLPELLYRASFGSALFEPRPEWAAAPDAIPILSPSETWDTAVKSGLRHRRRPNGERLPLDWMPATVYRGYWPEMEAFALPSYYDGRLRVNLVGRERNGLVPVAAYDAKLDAICALLAECRDPRTDQPVVRAIKRPVAADPLKAGPTEADLVIVWQARPSRSSMSDWG